MSLSDYLFGRQWATGIQNSWLWLLDNVKGTWLKQRTAMRQDERLNIYLPATKKEVVSKFSVVINGILRCSSPCKSTTTARTSTAYSVVLCSPTNAMLVSFPYVRFVREKKKERRRERESEREREREREVCVWKFSLSKQTHLPNGGSAYSYNRLFTPESSCKEQVHTTRVQYTCIDIHTLQGTTHMHKYIHNYTLQDFTHAFIKKEIIKLIREIIEKLHMH